MISRRRVLATGSAFLAWPATGAGQDTGKVYHVAYLGGSLVSGFHEAFAQQLMELGWRPGQNVRIEYRWYEGKLDLARELAQALVQQRPDVLLVVGPFGALAARDATTSIPVVFALASNPIRTRPAPCSTATTSCLPRTSRTRRRSSRAQNGHNRLGVMQ